MGRYVHTTTQQNTHGHCMAHGRSLSTTANASAGMAGLKCIACALVCQGPWGLSRQAPAHLVSPGCASQWHKQHAPCTTALHSQSHRHTGQVCAAKDPQQQPRRSKLLGMHSMHTSQRTDPRLRQLLLLLDFAANSRRYSNRVAVLLLDQQAA